MNRVRGYIPTHQDRRAVVPKVKQQTRGCRISTWAWGWTFSDGLWVSAPARTGSIRTWDRGRDIVRGALHAGMVDIGMRVRAGAHIFRGNNVDLSWRQALAGQGLLVDRGRTTGVKEKWCVRRVIV